MYNYKGICWCHKSYIFNYYVGRMDMTKNNSTAAQESSVRDERITPKILRVIPSIPNVPEKQHNSIGNAEIPPSSDGKLANCEIKTE